MSVVTACCECCTARLCEAANAAGYPCSVYCADGPDQVGGTCPCNPVLGRTAPDRLAPDAEVTVPEGGAPIRFGDGGPVIGTVTDAAVVDGWVVVSGTIDGRKFEGVADWPGRAGVEPDWDAVDEARRRPLPLSERWRHGG